MIKTLDFGFGKPAASELAHKRSQLLNNLLSVVLVIFQLRADFFKELNQKADEVLLVDLIASFGATHLVGEPHQSELEQAAQLLL